MASWLFFIGTTVAVSPRRLTTVVDRALVGGAADDGDALAREVGDRAPAPMTP